MRQRHVEAGSGKESVWDYPRPPRLERTHKRVEVEYGGIKIADTMRAFRVLETSHPPVYYVPPEDIRAEHLRPADGASLCEWKGRAAYYDVVVDGERPAERAAWYYPDPVPAYRQIKDYVAFYPSRMDACRIDGEEVLAQDGDFYGGWITADIVGPFKGAPGTWGW